MAEESSWESVKRAKVELKNFSSAGKTTINTLSEDGSNDVALLRTPKIGRLEEEQNRFINAGGKPLYQALKEAKEKQQEEWETAHNPFLAPKGIDEEELYFLQQVEKEKKRATSVRDEEEKSELERFHQARAKHLHSGHATAHPEDASANPYETLANLKVGKRRKTDRQSDLLRRFKPKSPTSPDAAERPKPAAETPPSGTAAVEDAKEPAKDGGKAEEEKKPEESGLSALAGYGSSDDSDDDHA